nr:MAG TPA: Protein of unknown function (DUF418) [Caudoviricetes sp.]
MTAARRPGPSERLWRSLTARVWTISYQSYMSGII